MPADPESWARGAVLSTSLLQVPSSATETLKLLVVGESDAWPPALTALAERSTVCVRRAEHCAAACDADLLSDSDAVVIAPPQQGDFQPADLQLFADALLSHRLTGVVMTDDPTRALSIDGPLAAVATDVSGDELWGRVCTIRQYRPLLRQLERQVTAMQRLGKKLNQQFVEVDQELRLASRLQRDFLPKSFPEVGDIRFAALFRPASWVSGDIYDVFRVDEDHIACYLADAVGHGIAAGLLTMFIKQAVISKRIQGEGYCLVSPSQVLADLNLALTRQELPNCQFVTSCYVLINVPRHEITFARGGHPHPILVNAAGRCTEVSSVGGLLGVFPEETFPATTLQLQPGEKFILYSDGLEDMIAPSRTRENGELKFSEAFLNIARLPLTEAFQTWATRMDTQEGSLQPMDDMSVIAFERLA